MKVNGRAYIYWCGVQHVLLDLPKDQDSVGWAMLLYMIWLNGSLHHSLPSISAILLSQFSSDVANKANEPQLMACRLWCVHHCRDCNLHFVSVCLYLTKHSIIATLPQTPNKEHPVYWYRTGTARGRCSRRSKRPSRGSVMHCRIDRPNYDCDSFFWSWPWGVD